MSSGTVIIALQMVPASRARQRVSCKPEPQRIASRHHAGDNRLLSGLRRVAPNRKRHDEPWRTARLCYRPAHRKSPSWYQQEKLAA
jgi:hypothetical protein